MKVKVYFGKEPATKVDAGIFNILTKGFIEIIDEAEGIDALTRSFMPTYYVSVYLKDGTSYKNEIGRDFVTNILNGTFHVAEDC